MLSTAAPRDCAGPHRRPQRSTWGEPSRQQPWGVACSEMVSSSQGGGSHKLRVGHLAWGWLGGPTCWEGAALDKCLPSIKAWLLKSCIIICTWLGYGAQSGTIYRLCTSWLLQESCHLHPMSSWGQEWLSRTGGDWQEDQRAWAQKVQLQAKQDVTPQHSISVLSSHRAKAGSEH